MKCELQVVKMRVGNLQDSVQVTHASLWVKNSGSNCEQSFPTAIATVTLAYKHV